MRCRRIGLAAVLALSLVAGCSGVPDGGSTAAPTTDPETAPTTVSSAATGTASSPPTGRVALPEGPKEPPERPPTLNASSVREYVRTYEYRYAYNALWITEDTEVTLDCTVDDVSGRPWGYAVVVTCSGYSNTRVPATATGTATPTPGPHADWFTQTYRYLVSETATERRDAERGDRA